MSVLPGQSTPPYRVLILGVGATKEKSLDPAAPDNIRDYAHNFDLIIELSYESQVADRAPVDRKINYPTDLLHGVANLSGFLTDKVRGELLPLRTRVADQIVVHSWAAPAFMEALNQGIIAQAPKQLVVVDPPNLFPAGGSKWRALGEAHPEMRTEIYITPYEIFNRVRVAAYVAQNPGQLIATYAWQDFADVSRNVLGNFAGTNVTVSTFSVASGSESAIAAHALRQFFDFAAASGLHGLTRANGSPTASARDGVGGETESSYLVNVSKSAAKVEAVKAQIETRQADIRINELASLEEIWRDAQNAAWQYFSSLTELACQTPDEIEHVDRAVYGVVFSQSTVRQMYGRSRSTLSPCASALMSAIINFDQPVTFKWVGSEAKRYQDRERKTAREREQARLRAQKAYERAVAAIASSARRDAREQSASRSTDRPSSSRITAGEGSGMRDVRGVLSVGGKYYDGR